MLVLVKTQGAFGKNWGWARLVRRTRFSGNLSGFLVKCREFFEGFFFLYIPQVKPHNATSAMNQRQCTALKAVDGRMQMNDITWQTCKIGSHFQENRNHCPRLAQANAPPNPPVPADSKIVQLGFSIHLLRAAPCGPTCHPFHAALWVRRVSGGGIALTAPAPVPKAMLSKVCPRVRKLPRWYSSNTSAFILASKPLIVFHCMCVTQCRLKMLPWQRYVENNMNSNSSKLDLRTNAGTLYSFDCFNHKGNIFVWL